MMPAGLLMIEHRLIERAMGAMKAELVRMTEQQRVDAAFIDLALDFFKTYADRCHHGKEEDILFRDLAEKPLSEAHRKVMDGLVEDHVYGRRTIGKLMLEKDRWIRGDRGGLTGAVACIKDLTEFYPRHIEKEDKHFFIPVMEYLSKAEQDGMIQAFAEFDRKMIREKYGSVVEQLERQAKERS